MSTEQSHTEQSNSVVIGSVEATLDVTVRREPEVGIAWEACCDAFGLCALGRSPGEAADNLGKTLKKRGLVMIINVDRKAVNALVKSRSTS